MRVAVTSSRSFDRRFLAEACAAARHEVEFFDFALTERTAPLVCGFPCVCAFVNDTLSRRVLSHLRERGLRLVALRSAGFNHVDVQAATELGLTVLRVPAYSPHAIAEHTLALMLTLNRKIHRAYNRVREQNFSLEGLLGFDMRGKTVGLIGAGRIGRALVKILHGLECRVLITDPVRNEECVQLGASYVPLEELLGSSDIVSLHCPLTPETHHLIDAAALGRMKPGAMLINTSRGAVIDTRAVIEALKSDQLGALGLDVYEEEGDLFFRDLSDSIITDDVFARLLTFPNVVITAHQAFFTREALTTIAETTARNIRDFENDRPDPANVVSGVMVV